MKKNERRVCEPINLASESYLTCPSCKGISLHHGKVEVFDRDEDNPRGVHVTVDGITKKDVIVTTGQKNNPSARSHGLNVHVFCCTCNKTFVLGIQHHKGTTQIDWMLKVQDQ